jgi:hypothetical protein
MNYINISQDPIVKDLENQIEEIETITKGNKDVITACIPGCSYGCTINCYSSDCQGGCANGCVNASTCINGCSSECKTGNA